MQLLQNIGANIFSNSTQESKSTRSFQSYGTNMSIPVQKVPFGGALTRVWYVLRINLSSAIFFYRESRVV